MGALGSLSLAPSGAGGAKSSSTWVGIVLGRRDICTSRLAGAGYGNEGVNGSCLLLSGRKTPHKRPAPWPPARAENRG